MSEAGKFLIYCIELYRRAKHIDGRTAYELFRSTGADDYVRRSYGALHTTGEQYILADIEGFMSRGQLDKPSPGKRFLDFLTANPIDVPADFRWSRAAANEREMSCLS